MISSNGRATSQLHLKVAVNKQLPLVQHKIPGCASIELLHGCVDITIPLPSLGHIHCLLLRRLQIYSAFVDLDDVHNMSKTSCKDLFSL